MNASLPRRSQRTQRTSAFSASSAVKLLSYGMTLLGVAAPALLVAQSQPRDTVQLAEIVVTPTSLPTPRRDVAAAVTVLTGAQLAERGISTVGEALRDVVGASVVQEGSFGGRTSPFPAGGRGRPGDARLFKRPAQPTVRADVLQVQRELARACLEAGNLPTAGG